MEGENHISERDDVVIRFSGDSGDGMQMTGKLFTDTAALMGNGISTFPDFPAEIRAPQGTVSGVSGFQVHIGDHPVSTPGDYCGRPEGQRPLAEARGNDHLRRRHVQRPQRRAGRFPDVRSGDGDEPAGL